MSEITERIKTSIFTAYNAENWDKVHSEFILHYGSDYLKKLYKYDFSIWYTFAIEFRDKFFPHFSIHFPLITVTDLAINEQYYDSDGNQGYLNEIKLPSEEELDFYEYYIQTFPGIKYRLYSFSNSNYENSMYIGFAYQKVYFLQRILEVKKE